MTILVNAPFADVRGDTLRWALGLPPQPTLASRVVALADGRTVVLGVLGASHQVLVLGSRGEALLSETVACDLPDAAPLPATTEQEGYLFDALVERLSPADLSVRVDHLTATLGDDPRAIVAAFPGAPDAVTALALDSPADDRLRWRTWHAYPQTGELVCTTTTLYPTGERSHGS